MEVDLLAFTLIPGVRHSEWASRAGAKKKDPPCINAHLAPSKG